MYAKKYSIATNLMLNQLSSNLSRQVRSVMTDNSGGLWFGTKGDGLLHIPDYRSCERAFQLFTQVAGRAGRANGNGRVVIQTYTPDHPAVVLASRHDYKGFYEYEIAQRRAALFPPYALFVRVLFIHEDQAPLCEAEERFALGLKDAILQALKAQGADERELLFMVWGED